MESFLGWELYFDSKPGLSRRGAGKASWKDCVGDDVTEDNELALGTVLEDTEPVCLIGMGFVGLSLDFEDPDGLADVDVFVYLLRLGSKDFIASLGCN
jgi:hypothetical protein